MLHQADVKKKNLFPIQQMGKKTHSGGREIICFVKNYNFAISQNSVAHLHIVIPFIY